MAATKKPPAWHTDPALIRPGQKLALKINVKIKSMEDVLDKLDDQINDLSRSLYQAQLLSKSSAHVNKIQGLKDNLLAFEKRVQAELSELKIQLSRAQNLARKQSQAIPARVQSLFATLDQQCAQYIAAAKKAHSWLYRGAHGASEYLAASWNTRRVKDSDPHVQIAFDHVLAELGFTALRGNSIFATSDQDHASGFGDTLYVIFPLDAHSVFTYTNHPDITLESMEELGINKTKFNKFRKMIANFLKSTSNMDNDVYHTVSDKWISVEDVLQSIRSEVKQGNSLRLPPEITNAVGADFVSVPAFKQKYRPKNTDLAAAIKNQWEVCVSGRYYALDAEKYGTWLAAHYGVSV